MNAGKKQKRMTRCHRRETVRRPALDSTHPRLNLQPDILHRAATRGNRDAKRNHAPHGFFAVALALLYAGWSYQQDELVVSVCFMLAAIALTVVTRLTVRRQII